MACTPVNGPEATAESHPYRITLPPRREWRAQYRTGASEWLRSDEAQGTFTFTDYGTDEGVVGAYARAMVFSDEMTALAFRMRFV